MSLRDRAAAAAGDGLAEGGAVPARPNITTAPLEDIEYTGEITNAEKVPVHTAWARVMADVQSITKGDIRNDVGGRYNFRGVDRVVNAVGPALRRHGVLLLPVKVFDVEFREARTAKGTPMQDCTLKVKWMVVGPAGDTLPEPLESAGQATDTQDKATAKATSVAQRVLFLTALHIPTQDPDVDRGHERGEHAGPTPNQYRDEIVDPRTSLGRLRQIRTELRQHGRGAVPVVNEVGDEEPLLALCERIGRQRTEAGEGQ